MTGMKLSVAIRLGSMLAPQGAGGWMDKVTRCALASACDAVGIAPEPVCHFGRRGIDYYALRAMFPILRTWVKSPFTGCDASVEIVIACANDTRNWTRERIADWVETIEQQQALPLAAPVAVEA